MKLDHLKKVCKICGKREHPCKIVNHRGMKLCKNCFMRYFVKYNRK